MNQAQFKQSWVRSPLRLGSSHLRVLWESGFRIADLMDFHWEDANHISPFWPQRSGRHPTIVIPSTQKNGRVQEIPLLPGLAELLKSVPKAQRTGWVVNPRPIAFEIEAREEWWRPNDDRLQALAQEFSNCAIACNVSEAAVRKWLKDADIQRNRKSNSRSEPMSAQEIRAIRRSSQRRRSYAAGRKCVRLTTERVSRVIAQIGKEAGIVVRKADPGSGRREKFASAHDLRPGCAQRLINAGVSAETLKVIMRHKDFATTEKHYGAIRDAQSAAQEIDEKLKSSPDPAICGGITGGTEVPDGLSPEELVKLKHLLNSL